MKIGIPALAGLSVLHGLLPPHPGPLVAIVALKADMGLTLAFGLIIAVPTVIIAGPVFGSLVSPHVQAGSATPPVQATTARRPARAGVPGGDGVGGPRFGPTVLTMMLPVGLMLLRAVGELFLPAGSGLRAALDVAGAPIVALLAGVTVSMFTVGRAAGLNRGQLSDSIAGALPPFMK